MGKNRRVAMAVDLQWPYKRHHEVFAGAHRYAQEQGGWKFILDLYAELTLESKQSRAMYDGIIGRVTPQLAGAARAAGVPLVNVWHASPVSGVPLVTPDFEAAGRMAAEHLLARGFERFGFLGIQRQNSAKEGLAGFRAVLRAAGFSSSTLMVSANTESTATNWLKFTARLDEWMDGWSCPMGVFAACDLSARHVACACDRRGLNVPQDVALIGTHNEPVICLHPEPSLTSIDLGYERVGYRAAELLYAMMGGAAAPTEPIYLPSAELIPRRSTDSLAVEDQMVASALRFISEHSHEPIQVGHVAEGLHAPRRTLERRFSASLGRSVASEIARLRVERAKRKLVETKASIKSIAREFGFSNSLQMAVVFNRLEGMSPSVYRRQHRRMT
jgi:LacI family transcriptional regulator